MVRTGIVGNTIYISIHSTTRVETKTSLKCPCNASISIHSTTRVETINVWTE